MKTHHWRTVAGVVALAAVTGTGAARARAAGGAAQAAPKPAGCDPAWTVFARGLTNPRHIRVGPDGLLYVAEAGVGGDNRPTCRPPDNMFCGPCYRGGLSGRVSRVHPDGSVETVAEGIASFVDGTSEVLGTSDVAWIGNTLYVLTEGGGCTRGLPDHPAGILRVDGNGSLEYVADITAFIRSHPVEAPPLCGQTGDCEPDGVPHSMVAVGNLLYVVETNHNSVLRVDPATGSVERLYDMSVKDPAPIRIMQRGASALIGTFDGDILKAGLARRTLSFLQSGFNPVVDLVEFGGRLHLLEPFTVPWTPETGRVIRREADGSVTEVAAGLNFPMGLAEWGGDLYASHNSFFQGPVPGTGEIVKIACR